MADIPGEAAAGGISLVSQSGGLMNSFAELTTNRGIGANYLISSGNEAVLDMADYIDFLADDPATRVIACIMEGAKDGRRFRAAVERAARKKPLVVLKLGRSAFGQRATLAHTGTLAGRHEAFAALFRQNGVALVDSIDALVETAALFDIAPLPQGDRVVMMTVSGGATSLIGDLGEAAGSNFPPIGDGHQRAHPEDSRRRPRLRQSARHRRPAAAAPRRQHLGGGAGDARGRRHRPDRARARHARRRLGLAPGAGRPPGRGRQERARKPLMVVSFMSNSLTRHWRGYAQARGLPLVEDLERGLKAVRHLVDYAQFRRSAARAATQQPQHLPTSPRCRRAASSPRPTARRSSARPACRSPARSSPAIPPTPCRIAAAIGGPVALKIQSVDIPHKSDVGGVHLGARTAAEVDDAARQVLENARRNCPAATIDGILVQEMVGDGVEFILGMTYDDTFGPLVVCGAGGVTVEVFKDAAVLLPPFERRGGGAPRSRASRSRSCSTAFAARRRGTWMRWSIAACASATFVAATDGRFAAIDLNPVFVCARGRGVRIADALIETRDDGRTGMSFTRIALPAALAVTLQVGIGRGAKPQ